MSTRTVISGLAILIGTMGVGLTLYQRMAWRAVAAEVVALREITLERDRLRAEVAHWEARAVGTSLRDVRAAPPPPIPGRPGEAFPSEPAHARAEPEASANKNPTNLELVASDPEYQRIEVARHRAELRLKHGALYRKLGLSAEKIAAFEEAMMEFHQTTVDAVAAAVAQGLSASDPSLAALQKTNVAALGRKLRAALGDVGLREYSAYAKSVDARTTVDALAGKLYYTDAPLTLAQADQLAQLIMTHTTQPKSSGLIGARKNTNWDVVLAQAQTTLLPAQFATLQLLREKARLDQELGEISGRLLRGAAAASMPASHAPKPRG